jgi:hypothetical protein
MSAGDIQLRDVRRLRLGSDEALVLTIPGGSPVRLVEDALSLLKSWFPNNRVLVLVEGFELFVVDPE